MEFGYKLTSEDWHAFLEWHYSNTKLLPSLPDSNYIILPGNFIPARGLFLVLTLFKLLQNKNIPVTSPKWGF